MLQANKHCVTNALLLASRPLWSILTVPLQLLVLCLSLLILHYVFFPGVGFNLIASSSVHSSNLANRQQVTYMDTRKKCTMTKLTTAVLLLLPTTLSHYHSPPADAAPTVNVDSLFQYSTSRNHKVISQAVDFVVSMQTAPTCTRMAASHLMNECRLLEHAPDYAKARPEAYLDNVKTEYAAKLAVCELLSAQPVNPVPPPNCEILVPSSRHCSAGGSWWHARPEVSSDKQCYPMLKDHQYMQCLKSLQSTPQFWTSFSNARQNAVVMCQASRDAIDRENHLEIFKNLTQVLGGVTSTMQKTTEEYESIIREQRHYAEETRDSHQQLREDIQSVQEKAVATVGALDDKFHLFMESSISQLITALADSQHSEIVQIHERMQHFSQDLMMESSRLARHFTGELQHYHERALLNIQANHDAQVDSYNALSNHMGVAQETINRTNDVAGRSLTTVESIAQRLDIFETQTEHIAEGFAFLSAIPALVKFIVRGFVAILGILFIFAIMYKFSTRLATYVAGACSSAFLLYSCGVFDWFMYLPARITSPHATDFFAVVAGMSSTQKGAGIILVLWFGAYPVCRINAFLGSLIGAAVQRILGPYWVCEYSNEGGRGFLPSIEIPAAAPHREENAYGLGYPNITGPAKGAPFATAM